MSKFINIPGWGLLNLANVESIRPEYDDDGESDTPTYYRINYCHNHSSFISVENFEYIVNHLA